MTLSDGRQLPLAATYGAMSQIEAGDLTVDELMQAHVIGRMKLDEGASIMLAGINAAKKDVIGAPQDNYKMEDCARLLFEARFGTNEVLREEMGTYLLSLLWQPADAKKKAELIDWVIRPSYIPFDWPENADQLFTEISLP
ncbi:MAG: hypothetical protein AAGD13_00595 [Pseudomonadota bacterium]